MRIKDPENPGRVIPVILIMPQKNTKSKLSFSVAGSKKLIPSPKQIPVNVIKIVALFQDLKSLYMYITDPIIIPKNTLHTYNSYCTIRKSSAFEILK